MNTDTQNRNTLKGYFSQYATPTAEEFQELIDGMLNQKDDGIAKLQGKPLSISYVPPTTNSEASEENEKPDKPVLAFSEKPEDSPDWVLNLKAKEGAKTGLNISDGEGNSRLFIHKESGNVGIGTTNPKGKLHVDGDVYAKGHISLYAYEGDGSNNTAYIQASDQSESSSIALQFRTQKDGSFKEALRIDEDGNVGIGTKNPAAMLDVKGDMITHGSLNVVNGIQASGYVTLKGNVQYYNDANREREKRFSFMKTDLIDTTTSKGYKFSWRNAEGTPRKDAMIFHTNGQVYFPGGNIGIGTKTPTEKLEVIGNVKANNVAANSSRSLKKNIRIFSIQEAKKSLDQMSPVQYQLKADSNGEMHLGFVAEDAPDTITTPNKDGIVLNHAVALLTKVVKHQQEEIESLKKLVNGSEVGA